MKCDVRKKCVYMLFLCLSMNLFVGCKEKTVDYNMEGVTESTQKENGISNTVSRGKKSLKQFEDETRWVENLIAENSKGEEVPIHVGWDNVTIPDAEEMHVVEVKEPEFDAAYKKEISERIFKDAEVYYHDLAHLPKKDIEEQRQRCQALYQSAEGISGRMSYYDMMQFAMRHKFDLEHAKGWEKIDAKNVTGWKDALESEILRYDRALETAGTSYVPVGEYDVGEYLGTYSGMFYKLSFSESEPVRNKEGMSEADCFINCRGKEISFGVKDIYQVCPDEIKEIEGIYYQSLKEVVGNEVPPKNQCSLSEKEAEELAWNFVDGLKLDYSVYNHSDSLVWWTGKDLGKVAMRYLSDGYIFYFDAGIGSVSFPQFGTQETDGYFGKKKKESEEPQYHLRAQVEVYVNDKGVIGMRAYNPIEILTISDGVNLLPLEAIKGVIMEQVVNEFEKFRLKFTEGAFILDEENQMEYEFVNFERMELIYFRVRDKENTGYYSYIPVWRLAGWQFDYGIENQVLINAIDGSVIDFYEEA